MLKYFKPISPQGIEGYLELGSMGKSPKQQTKDEDGYMYVPSPMSAPPSKNKDGYTQIPTTGLEMPGNDNKSVLTSKQATTKGDCIPAKTEEVDGYLQPVDATPIRVSDKKPDSTQRKGNKFLNMSRFVKGKRQGKLDDIIALEERYTDMELLRSSPVSV